MNVLQVLADLISVVAALAGTLETHSHPGLGVPPSQQGALRGIRAMRRALPVIYRH